MHRAVLSTLAAEFSLMGEAFLVLLGLEVALEIMMLGVEATLLDFAVSGQLLQQGFNPLMEVRQFSSLLSPQRC